jgi:Na+/alanine symporter
MLLVVFVKAGCQCQVGVIQVLMLTRCQYSMLVGNRGTKRKEIQEAMQLMLVLDTDIGYRSLAGITRARREE